MAATDTVDRISNLPEFIAHRIVSFLPTRDASRVFALSKTWKRLSESSPILDISQTVFESALPSSLPASQKQQLFTAHLSNSFRRRDRSMKIDTFRLEVRCRWAKKDPEIDEAVKKALELNVQELDLYYRASFCDIPRILYSAKSITMLKLKGFELDPQELLSGCPFIEKLDLQDCKLLSDGRFSSTYLKEFKLVNCIGVCIIELDACNLELDACNLHSFSYSYFGGHKGTDKICLTGCIFLKNLFLENVKYTNLKQHTKGTEQWLEDNISVLKNLENLDLHFLADAYKKFFNLPPSLYLSKTITSLKLNGFEIGFQELLAGCISMQELSLCSCKLLIEEISSSTSLKKLELSNCTGLSSIFKLCARNLQSFSYLGSSEAHCNINLLDCMLLKNLSIKKATVEEQWLEDCISKFIHDCMLLKNLSIKKATVEEQWLEDCISKFIHLENLVLSNCRMFKRVKILHQNLRSLLISPCKGMVEFEIDCRSLRSFNYVGEIVTFKMVNPSGLIDATLAFSHTCDNQWFVKLRKLGLGDNCKELKLVCDSYKDMIFPEEVKDDYVPPFHYLKLLKIKCRDKVAVDYTDLVDRLLWLSPHLETLFVAPIPARSCTEFQYKAEDEDGHPFCCLEHSKECLQFQFQYKAEDEDGDSFCCLEHPKECWQHRLKKVTIKNCAPDAEKSLFQYFRENAKILEAIHVQNKN